VQYVGERPDILPSISTHADAIYLTGSTYVDRQHGQSSCFLGQLPLSNLRHWKTVVDPVTTGEGNAIKDEENMACRSLAHDEDYLWVAGVLEENGKDRNAPQHGFYTLYKRSHRNPDWDVLDAHLVEQQPNEVKVQLPDAMVILPGENEVFMAMVASNDDQLTPEYYKNQGKEDYPNLTAGADYRNRGYGYYVSIQVFKIQDLGNGPSPKFDRSAQLQTDKDVFVTGMSLIEEPRNIVLVGNVKGSNGQNFNAEREASDMDGFVIHMELSGLGMSEAHRFNSIENADDFIHNICEAPDGQSYFVVGATRGNMPGATMYGIRDSSDSLSPFIAKVDFATRETIWTTQFNAKAKTASAPLKSNAEAFGCHVIPHDDSIVYMGGVVYDGAAITETMRSAGSDDL
jgi:hypothetical protein